MIMNLILWLPLTLYRWVQAWLFPRTLFRYTYAPSSDAERERARYARNKIALAAYKVRKLEHSLLNGEDIR